MEIVPLRTSHLTRVGKMKKKLPASIKDLVEQEEKNWVAQNGLRRRLRYYWYEAFLFHAGQHPLLYSLILCYLLALAMLLGWQYPEIQLQGKWHSWESAEQLSYFTSLWGIQTTLAALVYPFVISFVALLVQGRPASKSTLQIYLLDSAAIVAGLSSLILVLAMGVQYLLLSSYSLKTAVVWVAFDTLWFLFNSVLTVWFLYRTIEFLRPDFEFEVVRRYLANFALPNHIRNNLRFQYFALAQTEGWLPGPVHSYELKGVPQVLIHSYGKSEGDAAVTIHLNVEKRLTNVRFVLLRLVIARWLRTAKEYKASPTSVKNGGHPTSILILPLHAGSIYEGDTVLCRVAEGPPLTYLQRQLIKLSFVFRRKQEERRHLTPSDLLSEAEATTRLAIMNRDVAGFESAYKKLVQLHELLIGICNVNDGNQRASYALVPDVLELFDRPIHVYWASSYRSIFEAAIDILSVEARPFRQLCYLISNLNGPEIRSAPSQIKTHLVRTLPVHMHFLGKWWIRRAEEQGFLAHDHANAVTLLRPDQAVYEDACREFVGGWESAKDIVRLDKDDQSEPNWAGLQDAVAVFSQHIDETAILLLEAVLRGDQTAAEWMADVLAKWGDHTYVSDYGPFYFQDENAYSTISMFDLSWDEAVSILDPDFSAPDRNGEEGVTEIQQAICSDALKNYRKDVWLLVTQILFEWATQQSGPNSLALHMITGFLQDTKWRGGGRTTDSLSDITAESFFSILFRQYGAGGAHHSSYENRLGQLVERAIRLTEERWVTGRIYSHSGSNDVRSLQKAQMGLLVILSSRRWTASDSMLKRLSLWSVQYPRSIRSLKDRIQHWLNEVPQYTSGTTSPSGAHDLAQQILTGLGKSHTAVEGGLNVTLALQEVQAYLLGIEKLAVSSASLNKAHLQEIADAASSRAFDQSTGEFPLQLFAHITMAGEYLQPFTLVRTVNKGELTEDELASRPVNSLESYAKSVADYVGHICLQDVVNKCTFNTMIAKTPEAYWDVLETESRRMRQQGLTPILIVDNATRPAWVWDWLHRSNRRGFKIPTGLQIERRKGRGKGYVADFNDIEVYSGPIKEGVSWLLAKEVFQQVRFTRHPNQLFIDVEARTATDESGKVDVRLTFCRDIEVGHSLITEIQY